ncbi:hypothetical protein DFJ74DRAFT_657578 [Hyaloraphidium curvatum]|nr:hypothetical protein DFJ74DRAFT_657578 [Hyaloraphidium curvatum]
MALADLAVGDLLELAEAPSPSSSDATWAPPGASLVEALAAAGVDLASLLAVPRPEAPAIDPSALFAPSPSPSPEARPSDAVPLRPAMVKKRTGPKGKRQVLTPEQKAVKQHERIMKNRAAAQDSRDRKRRYMAELETRNAELTQENSLLQARLSALEQSNAMLLARLDELSSRLALNQLASQLGLPDPLVHALVQLPPEQAGPGEPAAAPAPPRARRADLGPRSPFPPLEEEVGFEARDLDGPIGADEGWWELDVAVA